MRRRLLVLAALLALVLAIAAAAPPSAAYARGAPARAASEGCTCHSDASSEAQVEMKGLPAELLPQTAYELEIEVRGPMPDTTILVERVQSGEPHNSPSLGGFLIDASQGELSPLDDHTGPAIATGNTPASPVVLTQTDEGSLVRAWKVQWRIEDAMATGAVTFRVLGMAADGDGGSDDGLRSDLSSNHDHWTRATYTSQLPPPVRAEPEATPVPQDTPAPSLLLGLLAGLGALAWSRRRAA